MKVRLIKGPLFEQTREKGYEALYHILAKKVREGQIKVEEEKECKKKN
ncbi:hypothetical protein [Cytobacillus praedii]|nr:hypothetical protein [Cytobacillus praedii]